MAVQAVIGGRSRSQNQRRKRIVQTAAALALRGGVEAMQMRTVAERAGVALGTLYRYFPSKMELVVAVVTEELELLENSLARRPPAGATAAERAVDVLMRATRGLLREPELADALVRSLIVAETATDLGPRVTRLLWRVARRVPVPAPDSTLHTGDGPQLAGDELDPDSADYVLVSSLAGIWIFEVLELLRRNRDLDEVQERLDLVAGRLLAGFD